MTLIEFEFTIKTRLQEGREWLTAVLSHLIQQLTNNASEYSKLLDLENYFQWLF